MVMPLLNPYLSSDQKVVTYFSKTSYVSCLFPNLFFFYFFSFILFYESYHSIFLQLDLEEYVEAK